MFSILLMYLPNHPSLAERNILSLVYLNLYWIEQRNNLYDSNGINFSFFCLLLPSNKNISDLELDRALKDVVRISQNGKREILNGHKLDDRKSKYGHERVTATWWWWCTHLQNVFTDLDVVAAIQTLFRMPGPDPIKNISSIILRYPGRTRPIKKFSA